jgi:hypothetical protein
VNGGETLDRHCAVLRAVKTEGLKVGEDCVGGDWQKLDVGEVERPQVCDKYDSVLRRGL